MTEAPSSGETEGAIRFAYSLENSAGPVVDRRTAHGLRGWRAVLKRLGLVGQEPARYGGLGFGNLSARDRERPDQFVITASQTSGAATLEDDDLVRIVHSDPDRSWVDAVGRQPPSSETLTHAMIYLADARVNWVFHGHSPEIWQHMAALGLPATPEHVGYGTTAMAHAVAELLTRHPTRPLVFGTLGHRDGVFACGASADETGVALGRVLAWALS